MKISASGFHSSKKYTVAGIYWHPNRNLSEIICKFDENELQTLSVQSALDYWFDFNNIDLLKCAVHSTTAEYIDDVLINNFSSTLTMPSQCSTLVRNTVVRAILQAYGKW